MRRYVESLKRLYKAGKLTEESIRKLKLTEEEVTYILGE